MCLVFIPAPSEKGPSMLTKQAVVRFPLSFLGHLCALSHHLSSPVSRAKPSREYLDISSRCWENHGELRKRRTEDRVSLRNSLKEGLS